jgi:hypothetical protein
MEDLHRYTLNPCAQLSTARPKAEAGISVPSGSHHGVATGEHTTMGAPCAIPSGRPDNHSSDCRSRKAGGPIQPGAEMAAQG